MSETKVKSNDNDKKVESKESTLYYFYSVGCGWCKKADPIVDELNAEGHNILKLDLADETNRTINQELKKKYEVQCGTPWFVDAETGNGFCGFRDKETMLKWINGEEIPKPVRPTGPPPKPPLHGASKDEVKEWTEKYDEWYKKNEKLPNVKTSKEILDLPRPKSDPPPPPPPSASDDDLTEWSKKYDVWMKENDHLPNLIPTDKILDRFKAMRNQQQSGAPGTPGAPGMPGTNLNQGPANPADVKVMVSKLAVVEQKLDRLMNHLGLKNVPSPPPIANKTTVPKKQVPKNIKAKVGNENVKTKSK